MNSAEFEGLSKRLTDAAGLSAVDAGRLASWARVARSDGCVAMVGAGMTLQAGRKPDAPEWARAHTWAEIARNAWAELGGDVEDTPEDPLAVLDAYARWSRPELVGLFQQLVPEAWLVPGHAHLELVRVPWKIVFTTNYDKMVSAAYHSAGRTCRLIERAEHFARLGPWDGPPVVHLHGSFDAQDLMVVTSDDYDAYERDRPRMVERVRIAFEDHAVLLLGFSGNDPNYRRWRAWIEAAQKSGPRPHVSLVVERTTSSDAGGPSASSSSAHRFQEVLVAREAYADVLAILADFLQAAEATEGPLKNRLDRQGPATGTRRHWRDRVEEIAALAADPKLDAGSLLDATLAIINRMRAQDGPDSRALAERLLSDSAEGWLRRELGNDAVTMLLRAAREDIEPLLVRHPEHCLALEQYLPGSTRRAMVRDGLGAAWPRWAAAAADIQGAPFRLVGVLFKSPDLGDAEPVVDPARRDAWSTLVATIENRHDSDAIEGFHRDYGLATTERDWIENLDAWRTWREGGEIPLSARPRTPEQHARSAVIALQERKPEDALRHYRDAARASQERQDDSATQTLFIRSALATFQNWRGGWTAERAVPEDIARWRDAIDDLERNLEEFRTTCPRAARWADREIEGLRAQTLQEAVRGWGGAGMLDAHGPSPDAHVLRTLEQLWVHPGWTSEAGYLVGLKAWSMGRTEDALSVWSRHGDVQLEKVIAKGTAAGASGVRPDTLRRFALVAGRSQGEWHARLGILRGAWPAIGLEDLDTWSNWLQACDEALADNPYAENYALAGAFRDRLLVSGQRASAELVQEWVAVRPLSAVTLRWLFDQGSVLFPYNDEAGTEATVSLLTTLRDGLAAQQHDHKLYLGVPVLERVGQVIEEGSVKLPPGLLGDFSRWAAAMDNELALRVRWARIDGEPGRLEAEVSAALRSPLGPTHDACLAALRLGTIADIDVLQSTLSELVGRGMTDAEWPPPAGRVALLALALRQLGVNTPAVDRALDDALSASAHALQPFLVDGVVLSEEDLNRVHRAVRGRLIGYTSDRRMKISRTLAVETMWRLATAGRWQTTRDDLEWLTAGLVGEDDKIAKVSGWTLAALITQEGFDRPLPTYLNRAVRAVADDPRVHARAGVATLVRQAIATLGPDALDGQASHARALLQDDRRVLVQAALAGPSRTW